MRQCVVSKIVRRCSALLEVRIALSHYNRTMLSIASLKWDESGHCTTTLLGKEFHKCCNSWSVARSSPTGRAKRWHCDDGTAFDGGSFLSTMWCDPATTINRCFYHIPAPISVSGNDVTRRKWSSPIFVDKDDSASGKTAHTVPMNESTMSNAALQFQNNFFYCTQPDYSPKLTTVL